MRELLPKQKQAIYYLKDLTTTELVYGGAAGGAKTALGVTWLLSNCLLYPGTRWLMGRSKLKNLKQTTLKSFFEISKKLGLSDEYRYNQQDQVIYFTNGSEIILKDLFLYPSDPDFDSLGSLEITGAFVDECNQIVYKAWQIVKSRCRFMLKDYLIDGTPTKDLAPAEYNEVGEPVAWHHNGGVHYGLVPKILGTCNPAKNFVYSGFYKPWRARKMLKNRRFIQALPGDNPHLAKAYIRALLELEERSRRRLYYGDWEFDDDPATLIHTDAIDNYFDYKRVKPSGDKYLTIDVARKGADKTIFRVWHGWQCIERVYMAKSLTNEVVEVANALRKKHNIAISNTIADEDGVGGGVVDFLKCKGFVNNSKPLNGENFENLKAQCYVKMAAKIMAGEVTEVCEETDLIALIREEMEQVKLKDLDKDSRVGVVDKKTIILNIGRSPDDWDSIAMRYYFELKPVRSFSMSAG